jgi:hypothetical protein
VANDKRAALGAEAKTNGVAPCAFADSKPIPFK